jgi:hypothetical protein
MALRAQSRDFRLRSFSDFFNNIGAMPTNEFNSHDVRFQAERMFYLKGNLGRETEAPGRKGNGGYQDEIL